MRTTCRNFGNESELNAALETKLLPEGTNYVTREKLEKWDYPLAIQKITAKTVKEYEKKIEEISAMGVDFSDVERRVLLMTVDRNWIDHIDAMDQLRKGIGLLRLRAGRSDYLLQERGLRHVRRNGGTHPAHHNFPCF